MAESLSTEHGSKGKCPVPSSAEGLPMLEPNFVNINELCLNFLMISLGTIIFWIQLAVFFLGNYSSSLANAKILNTFRPKWVKIGVQV